MEAAAPEGKEPCLGSGETQPIAVGKDDVAGLPHQLHLLERRVPQALMGDPERIDPNDPCRPAPAPRAPTPECPSWSWCRAELSRRMCCRPPRPGADARRRAAAGRCRPS